MGAMTERTFRFGIVAGQRESADALAQRARRLESQGYGIMLFPDTAFSLSPHLAAAVVAAATTTLHAGSHVLSVANRTPGLVAAEVAGLAALSGGRYELGVGIGRPGAEREASAYGMPFGSVGARMTALTAVVDAVRAAVPETPVMVAAGKTRMLQLAARSADIITLGLAPIAGEDDLQVAIRTVHDAAGGRMETIELAQNLVVVGDDAPDQVLRWTGTDLAGLRAAGSVAELHGTPGEMADLLRRRRDRFGVSYVSTSALFADRLAPVVELLAGS
jgi:alkanesulfonate monooxygenase SsuD/methylene tetrahydromethanopterin reductase-like flavin-dependent oxidoreductase (luciferase family)